MGRLRIAQPHNGATIYFRCRWSRFLNAAAQQRSGTVHPDRGPDEQRRSLKIKGHGRRGIPVRLRAHTFFGTPGALHT